MKKEIIFILLLLVSINLITAEDCSGKTFIETQRCYRNLSNIENNPNLCDAIDDKEIWIKGNCYNDFLIKKGSSDFCNELENSDKCFYYLGRLNDDNSQCNKIINENLRKECEQDVYVESSVTIKEKSSYHKKMEGRFFVYLLILGFLTMVFLLLQFFKRITTKISALNNFIFIFLPFLTITFTFLFYGIMGTYSDYLYRPDVFTTGPLIWSSVFFILSFIVCLFVSKYFKLIIVDKIVFFIMILLSWGVPFTLYDELVNGSSSFGPAILIGLSVISVMAIFMIWLIIRIIIKITRRQDNLQSL